jgi:hypothetical protein
LKKKYRAPLEKEKDRVEEENKKRTLSRLQKEVIKMPIHTLLNPPEVDVDTLSRNKTV